MKKLTEWLKSKIKPIKLCDSDKIGPILASVDNKILMKNCYKVDDDAITALRLGKGQTGVVYLVNLKDLIGVDTDDDCNCFISMKLYYSKQKSWGKKEIALLEKVKGDNNFLQLIKEIDYKRDLAIITEFCRGLTLDDFGKEILKNEDMFNYYQANKNKIILHIVKLLWKVLFRLHNIHHIVHKDLNLTNIMISLNSSDNLILQLIDFGSACSFDLGSETSSEIGSDRSETASEIGSDASKPPSPSSISYKSISSSNIGSECFGGFGITPLFYSRSLCEKNEIIFHDYWTIIVAIYYLYNLKYPNIDSDVLTYYDKLCKDPEDTVRRYFLVEDDVLQHIQLLILNYNYEGLNSILLD